jgi:NitT/TauT family transport system permease protein
MKNFWRTLAGIALLILLWQIAAVSLNKSILVPAPSETLRLMARNFTSLEVLVAAWQTAWKVFAALALAILLGLPLGVLLGLSDGAYHLLRPLIMTVQAVPVISWLSLVISPGASAGAGRFSFLLSLFPLAVLTTVAGVHDLDKGLLEWRACTACPPAKSCVRFIWVRCCPSSPPSST